MSNFDNVLIVIPSYCPPKEFPQLVDKLLSFGFRSILVVNDGSPSEYDYIFQTIQKKKVLVTTLPGNYGKGTALRHGISEASKHFPEKDYYVFCDDDGQHDPIDVKDLSAFGVESEAKFLIGTRDISKMPFKSFIGNFIMRLLLKYVKNINIPDTQSGLRFMHRDCALMLKSLQHERFSFELHSLLLMKSNNIKITTFFIQTIYFNKNASTRFLPFQDSMDVIKSLFSGPKEKDKFK